MFSQKKKKKTQYMYVLYYTLLFYLFIYFFMRVIKIVNVRYIIKILLKLFQASH